MVGRQYPAPSANRPEEVSHAAGRDFRSVDEATVSYFKEIAGHLEAAHSLDDREALARSALHELKSMALSLSKWVNLERTCAPVKA